MSDEQPKTNEPLLILNDQGGGAMSVSYEITGTLRAQEHGHQPIVLIYDARGNGGGAICPTITGDHEGHISDYTAIVVEHEDFFREEIFPVG